MDNTAPSESTNQSRFFTAANRLGEGEDQFSVYDYKTATCKHLSPLVPNVTVQHVSKPDAILSAAVSMGNLPSRGGIR